MKDQIRDNLAFFQQFRKQFETTGAILPSSRFLARAITGPLSQRNGPARILEVGPGTGPVTRRIVQLLRPEDQLDLVELNDDFVECLKRRFEEDPVFQPAAHQTTIHHCALQDFHADAPYDFIISGLPLNNFSAELVGSLFESFFQFLAPQGVLSYFEYMYVRAFRKIVSRGAERTRIHTLDGIIREYLTHHRFRRNWIFVNVPPAWVQHLRRENGRPPAIEDGAVSAGD